MCGLFCCRGSMDPMADKPLGARHSLVGGLALGLAIIAAGKLAARLFEAPMVTGATFSAM